MHDHITTVQRRVLCGLLLIGGILFSVMGFAKAADLPVAPASPIAGISFDDPPLLLPVQRNFQMAMLLSSSELGRSCGKMEAYGWRFSAAEQPRVNQVFNNTVDRLRAQGYTAEAKTVGSVSKDVTLFTADRPDKHLILLWSAGEIGLVMVLCETSAPLPSTAAAMAPQQQTLSQPMPQMAASMPMPIMPRAMAQQAAPERSGVLSQPSPLTSVLSAAPSSLSRTGKPAFQTFRPEGAWVGSYACSQGTTGATLLVKKLKGDQFEGVFSFYPTPKNPNVPRGSYVVFGEYDTDSMRILLNPGKWIEHPKNYANTIMIGSFDPVAGTFSGFFQGITGCTSFEAKYDRDNSPKVVEKEPVHKTKKAVKKKGETAAIKKTAAKAKPAALAPVSATNGPISTTTVPAASKETGTAATKADTSAPEGIKIGAPSTAQ